MKPDKESTQGTQPGTGGDSKHTPQSEPERLVYGTLDNDEDDHLIPGANDEKPVPKTTDIDHLAITEEPEQAKGEETQSETALEDTINDVEETLEEVESDIQSKIDSLQEEQSKFTATSDVVGDIEDEKIEIIEEPAVSGSTILKVAVVFIVGFAIFGFGLAGYALNLFNFSVAGNVFDDALKHVQDIETYQNDFVIETIAGPRRLFTEGIAEVDSVNDSARIRYQSRILGVTFDSDVRIFGDELFARVTYEGAPSESPFELPGRWLSTPYNTVPAEYEEFIGTKYFRDVLSIFRNYPKEFTTVSETEVIGPDNRPQIRYTAELSPSLIKQMSEQSEDDSFADLLAKSGIVDVWVNKSSSQIEKVVVESKQVSFTSNITNINDSFGIERPTESLPYDALKQQVFYDNLPDEKIETIGIIAYGDVDGETLDIMQQAINDELNIHTQVLANKKEGMPKIKGFYDEERNQFNGDVLWQFFFENFKAEQNPVRFIVIIQDDLFSILTKSKPYVMTRSSNVNTAIISTARLRDVHSDHSDEDEPVSDRLYTERLRKLTLRTVGVTAGLRISPSAERMECLMYPAFSLEELDAKGSQFCEETTDVFDRTFKQIGEKNESEEGEGETESEE